MSADAPNKKILIIEDEITQRILAKEFLEMAGYRVRTSEDGRHGLNMANKIQPDLIILDLMLPSIDGYKLCKFLKETEKTADIPIILVTASKEQDVIKRGLEAGADDFVTKPVDWQFLEDRVAFVLAQTSEKRAIDAKLADSNPGNIQAERSRNEALTITLQKIQDELEVASADVEREQEKRAVEIAELQAKANDEFESALSKAGQELADAKALHADERNQLETSFEARLNDQKAERDDQLLMLREQSALELADAKAQIAGERSQMEADFEARLLDQKVKYEEQMASIKEQCDLELALVKDDSNTLVMSARAASLELEQRVGERIKAMWNIVSNTCERHDDILASMIDPDETTDAQTPIGERVATLTRQAEQVSQSNERLKKLAHVMAEQDTPNGGELNVNDFISGLADRLRQIAARNQVTIRVGDMPEESNISADLHRMRYAMTLLSINALRSTPASGEITLSAAFDDAGDVKMSISDTGAGMSQVEVDGWVNCLDKAWAMPAENNVANNLHIPIVTALIRQQGGELKIDSRKGFGSSYSLVFPRHDGLEGNAMPDNNISTESALKANEENAA